MHPKSKPPILVSDLIQGKKEAYFNIYRLFYQELCIYAAKMIKNTEDAEDLVQDAVIKLWKKRDSLDVTLKLKAYLYRSVYNHAIDYIKARQKDLSVRENMLLQAALINNTLEDEGRTELLYEMNRIINNIPEKTKKVFIMSRDEGFSYKEIAERLNITTKGVEYHMTKAFKILEKELNEYVKTHVS